MNWASAQSVDPVLEQIRQLIRAGSPRPSAESITRHDAEFKTLVAQYERMKIVNDILYREWHDNTTGRDYDQLIVPQSKRGEIADQFHRGLNGGHLGHRRSILLLQRRYYWPGLSTAVHLAKERCFQCARYQRPRPHHQGPLQPMTVGEPWERVGIDVTGPHPTSSKGNVYILTVIDHFTKWAEMFPMRNQEARTVAKILFDKIICVHGCPLQILSDQGTNFESRLFKELCTLMSIDKIRTTPYKPSTNGNVERLHATMHSMIAKLVSGNQRDWDEKLPVVAFAYRTSVQETTRFTPFFLMFGREARVPADLVYGATPRPDENPDIPEFVKNKLEDLREAYSLTREHLQLAANRRKHRYDLRTRPRSFSVDSWVWVFVPRRTTGRYTKWQSRYEGPFQVKRQLGPVTYLVQRTPRHRPWTVHVDKMKPCHGNITAASDEGQAPASSASNQTQPDTEPHGSRPRRTIRRPARFLS